MRLRATSVGYRSPARLGAVVVAAWLFAACQSDGDDGGGEGIDLRAIDAPCKLVTKSEFLAHVNVPPGTRAKVEPLARGTSLPLPSLLGAQWCSFSASKKKGGAEVAQVGVVRAFADEAFARTKREAASIAKQNPQAFGIEPVEGLGKEAVWQRRASDGVLVVLHGETVLAIAMTVNDPENGLTRARALAAKALERL